MTGWKTSAARPESRRRFWGLARLAGGALILTALVLRVGTGPFLDGFRRIDPGALAAALSITALTTIGSAWRWRRIALGLGLDIPLRAAVAAYYRSQFLNSTLPGGVLGDLHRGLRQGRAAQDVSTGLRSVVWDRAAGQIVQVVLAGVVLMTFASPVRAALGGVAGLIVAFGVVLALLVMMWPARGDSWPARAVRRVRDDLRAGLLPRDTWPAVLGVSAVVVAGHVAVFLVAARAAGVSASVSSLLPLAMLVLLAMTVPTSIGGWGPREGVAAWAFSLAGLGVDRGVTTATVYGILSLVATLPGLIVLVLSWRRPPAGTDELSHGAPVELPDERPARSLVPGGARG